MKLKHLLSILLCCTLMSVSFAQKSHFTEFNNQELPNQMLEYLNQATSDKDKKAANETLIKTFRVIYNDMNLETKDRLVEISNVVLKLKVRPLPDVYKFVSTLSSFYNFTNDRANFNEWLSCIEYIQSRNKKVKDFTDFIDFTSSFLTDRTLYQSRSSLWQTQNGIPFELKLQNGQITLNFNKPFELYYSSDQDNGTIYGTTGTYYYFDNRWVGRGGRLNWDRTGIPNTACWAVRSE